MDSRGMGSLGTDSQGTDRGMAMEGRLEREVMRARTVQVEAPTGDTIRTTPALVLGDTLPSRLPPVQGLEVEATLLRCVIIVFAFHFPIC